MKFDTVAFATLAVFATIAMSTSARDSSMPHKAVLSRDTQYGGGGHHHQHSHFAPDCEGTDCGKVSPPPPNPDVPPPVDCYGSTGDDDGCGGGKVSPPPPPPDNVVPPPPPPDNVTPPPPPPDNVTPPPPPPDNVVPPPSDNYGPPSPPDNVVPPPGPPGPPDNVPPPSDNYGGHPQPDHDCRPGDQCTKVDPECRPFGQGPFKRAEFGSLRARLVGPLAPIVGSAMGAAGGLGGGALPGGAAPGGPVGADGKALGYGPANMGPDGFDPSASSSMPGDPTGKCGAWNNHHGGGSCPPSFNPDGSNCCYDAYGNLAHPTPGCKGEVTPPPGRKSKQPFVCNPYTAKGSLINGNVGNCLDVCVASKGCKRQKCKVKGSSGALIDIDALNCANINILSSITG